MINSVEEIKNLAGNESFLKLFRIDFQGLRLYIQPEPFRYFSGLTGALGKSTFKGDPAERRLQGWRESMIDSYGKANADNYVSSAADFGTLTHEALVTIKEKGKIVWSEERDRANAYFSDMYMSQGQIPNAKIIQKMAYEYCKHVASIMQFVSERVQTIYAIETAAIWDEMLIATPIDFVCECRQTPKGDFEDTTINIKTSKQVTGHHLDQAACELVMWNDTYSEIALCENTAILRTKDWTEGKTPTYDYKYLKGQDAFERVAPIIERLKLCLKSDATYYPEPTFKKFTGETKIGDAPVIDVITLEQEWIEYWENKK